MIPLVYGYFFIFAKKIKTMLIGRDKEKQILQNALTEEYSQFVAVYGRHFPIHRSGQHIFP